MSASVSLEERSIYCTKSKKLVPALVLYSPSLHQSLGSFLSYAPRNGVDHLPKVVRTSFRELCSLVLAVFVRMCKPRENEIFDRIEQQLIGFSSNPYRLADLTSYLLDVSWSMFTLLSVLLGGSLFKALDICHQTGLTERMASLFENAFIPLQNAVEADLQLTVGQRQELLDKLAEATTYMLTAIRHGLIEPCLLDRIYSGPRRPSATAPQVPSTSGPSTADLVQEFTGLMLQLLNHRKFSLALHLLYPIEADVQRLRQAIPEDCIDEATVQYLLGATECLIAEAGLPANLDQRNKLSVVVPPEKKKKDVTPVAGSSISGPVQKVREILPDMAIDLIERCLVTYDGDTERVINAALEGTIPEEVMLNPDSSKLKKPKPPPSHPTGEIELDLASAAATGVLAIDPKQLWQGKREPGGSTAVANELPNLGLREKRVTMRSAFTMDEYDDGEGGASKEPGWFTEEPETSENGDAEVPAVTNRMNQLSMDAYEDEYDDSYDVHEGAVDEAGSSDSSDGNVKKTGAYSAVEPTRQHVLRIENPEIVRQRQQQYWQSKQANRRGRSTAQRVHPSFSAVPPQPNRTDGFATLANPPYQSSSNVRPTGSFSVEGNANRTTKPTTTTSNRPARSNGTAEMAEDSGGGGGSSTSMASRPGGPNHHYKDVNKARLGNHNRRNLADRKRQVF